MHFKDKEDALVANLYDIEEYAKKMNYIFDYPEHSAKIGRKGRELSLKKFNPNNYAKLLLEYVDNIITRS